MKEDVKEPENMQEKEEKSEDKERIVPRLIEDEMKQSYVDYAMSVIIGRALPDVRDGLKPVFWLNLIMMLLNSL